MKNKNMVFKSPLRTAEHFLAQVAGHQTGHGTYPSRVLLLAAHPDDETIGASAVLGRIKDVDIVYLTDGAPRDPRFRSPHVSGSRDFYACVRAEEAASALAWAGISSSRITFLGATDQESIYEVPALLECLVSLMTKLQPSVVITHPYEGGHPDHDTAALLARMAARELQQAGSDSFHLVEMTSYHARDGRRACGEFIPFSARTNNGQAVLTLKLSSEERARKARMLGCYLSQWHVLSEFPLEPERLRIAPLYDFTRPPHDGLLWYETLGWPLTGAQWREMAARTLRFDEMTCR
jgi:LmbE family N-acetylglucosaminyl deacetylase